MSHEYLTNREDFVAFLRETLAPYCRESGKPALAADLLAACHFIEGAATVAIDCEEGEARVISTR